MLGCTVESGMARLPKVSRYIVLVPVLTWGTQWRYNFAWMQNA